MLIVGRVTEFEHGDMLSGELVEGESILYLKSGKGDVHIRCQTQQVQNFTPGQYVCAEVTLCEVRVKRESYAPLQDMYEAERCETAISLLTDSVAKALRITEADDSFWAKNR